MPFNSHVKNITIGAVSGGVTAAIISLIILANGNLGASPASVIQTNTPEPLPNISAQEDMIIAAVEKATPAVVSIIITKDVPILKQYYEESTDPFNDFFGQIPQYKQEGTEKKEVGGGSGFIVSQDGYLITNKHVVEDEEAEYTVFTNDGKEYKAEVLAKDSLNDIAVLKIDAENLPYLTFGDSEKLRVGQSVIAIGNPLLEFSNSVSVGVISGLSRSIIAGDSIFGNSEQLEGVIQTDAAINPGNSGGPLLNLKGEVIGVNVAIASGENLGFSLPSNMVSKVFKSVKETGKIVRAYLGIRYIPVTAQLKEANNLEVDYGILVIKGQNTEELAVIPGSPADKAGLEENDIILEIDGKKIDNETSFAHIIAEKEVGDKITLKVLHDGDEKEVTVTLEETPTEKIAPKT